MSRDPISPDTFDGPAPLQLEGEMPLKRTAVWRGFRRTCPRCGEAPLFAGYLRQVEDCAHCHYPWSTIRADDGPAWGTMLVVGHVLALVFHIVIFRMDLSTWGAIAVLCAVATVASLLLLPRMKGLFIAWIWRTGSLMS